MHKSGQNEKNRLTRESATSYFVTCTKPCGGVATRGMFREEVINLVKVKSVHAPRDTICGSQSIVNVCQYLRHHQQLASRPRFGLAIAGHIATEDAKGIALTPNVSIESYYY